MRQKTMTDKNSRKCVRCGNYRWLYVDTCPCLLTGKHETKATRRCGTGGSDLNTTNKSSNANRSTSA